MNYFAIFGLEEKYDLSLKELKDKYLQLMQIYHPDRAQIGEAKEYIESDAFQKFWQMKLEQMCH